MTTNGNRVAAVTKVSVTLADGRELIYFGESAGRAAGYPDRREIGRRQVGAVLPVAGDDSPLAEQRVIAHLR